MKCMVDGCYGEVEYEATLKVHCIPEALLEKEKATYQPARIKPGVLVCKLHKNLDAYDILTEERFTQIALEIHKKKGTTFIDRDNLEVEWNELE